MATRRPALPRPVALRSIYRGRVWVATPGWLLEDSAERVAIAILPGARGQAPAVPRPAMIPTLGSGAWRLAETTWHTNRVLWLAPPGAPYMVGHFWDDATDRFHGWYLNLQTPLRRTRIGFDLWDQVLDVLVDPGGAWRWKDEAEFAEAIRLGVLDRAEAAAARAEGERLVASLDTLLPTGWEEWRPDPAWPPLALPDGWDRVDAR